MDIPSCDMCEHPAKAWRRPWDNTLVCIMHFNKSFLKKVQKTINKYQMLKRGMI